MELYDVQDFWKFQLKVGEIREAERVPGKTKLIKMLVDFGGEVKTAVAGIGDQYEPSDLAGKKMIFVVNLKPKKVANVVSEAMMLVAEEPGGRVHLITVPSEVPNGSKVW